METVQNKDRTLDTMTMISSNSGQFVRKFIEVMRRHSEFPQKHGETMRRLDQVEQKSSESGQKHGLIARRLNEFPGKQTQFAGILSPLGCL